MSAARPLFGYLVISVFGLFYSFFAVAAKWPSEIAGTWQVAEVHINTESSHTTLYQWNDPRLVGRLFKFDENSVWNDTPEADECKSVTVKKSLTNPENLIGNSLAEYGYPSKKPGANAYQIDIEKGEDASIFEIYCGSVVWQSGLGVHGGEKGAWILPLSSNKILIRWYDETILLLNKLKKYASVKASFDCRNAKSPTERAICGSYELGAYDTSIDEAYKKIVRQIWMDNGNVYEIKKMQRMWLVDRNKCGGDEACLLVTMKRRLELLGAELRG